MVFENIEDENYKGQKLSFAEKAIITAASGVTKVILWKARKAKTYGDLQGLASLIEKKMTKLEEEKEQGLHPMESEQDIANKATEIASDITKQLEDE